MKTAPSSRQTSRQASHSGAQAAAPALADRGAALAPPAYGIDFVDRGAGGSAGPAALSAPGPGGGGTVIQRWPLSAEKRWPTGSSSGQ